MLFTFAANFIQLSKLLETWYGHAALVAYSWEVALRSQWSGPAFSLNPQFRGRIFGLMKNTGWISYFSPLWPPDTDDRGGFVLTKGFRDHSNTAEGIAKGCTSHEGTSGRRDKGSAVHSSFLYFLSISSCGMRSPTLRVDFSPSVNPTLRPTQMCLVTHTDVPHQRRLNITPTFPSYQTLLPDAQPREQPLAMTNWSLKLNPNVTLCLFSYI